MVLDSRIRADPGGLKNVNRGETIDAPSTYTATETKAVDELEEANDREEETVDAQLKENVEEQLREIVKEEEKVSESRDQPDGAPSTYAVNLTDSAAASWIDLTSWFSQNNTDQEQEKSESQIETRDEPSEEKQVEPKVQPATREITSTDKVDEDKASQTVKADKEKTDDMSASKAEKNQNVQKSPTWFSWLECQSQAGVAKSDTTDDDALRFDDLQSLPSVKAEDITIAGSAVHTVDLSTRADKSKEKRGNDENVASLVEEKVKKMKLPKTKTPHSKGAEAAMKQGKLADSSVEARRQLLVKELRSAIATFGRYEIRVANVSAALGDLLNEAGEHENAIKLHRDAVAIYSTKLGDDHNTTLNAKMQLGNVLENAEEYDEALNTYYLVSVMRRALRGDKDSTAADALVSIAEILRKKGEYTHAIKELKRSLKIYRDSLGDGHEKVSQTVDQIASLYVTIGDFEKSAAILEEVVKLKAATLGMKSKAVAETLLQLATTYDCCEQFTKAMKSLKKAYKIYTEMEGYSSEEATRTLNRIAQLYEATGDFNRASIAYLGVLRGEKINHGPQHLRVGQAYYKLGHSLRETGQHQKALKCMKEALPIFVGSGVEMQDVEMIAEIMHEMALINKAKKHFNEAARIFKQELNVRRKIGQPEFPLIARTLNHMGVTEFEMRNNNKALKYLVEALSIFQKHGEHGIDCAEVLFNSGLVFEASRNNERALEAYEEAARIFKGHGYKENHPHLMKCYQKIEKLKRMQSSGRKFRV